MLIRIYPAYTTVDAVKAELPSRFRGDEDLSDDQIQRAIDGQANIMDSRLARYYAMPARPLAPVMGDGPVDPSTGQPYTFVPGSLEQVNRFLAVHECLIVLRDRRGDEKSNKMTFQEDADAALGRIAGGDEILTYPFLHADGRPYFMPLADGSPLWAIHPLSGRQRVRSSYPERTFTRDTTRNWGP
ncbi:hypothetical protein [Deinococcus kurensis]|uniref:hypothetical protein n=1 Tax=Deinococcus kurensis TaxID=2662757 RepID=UPI0012D36E19|nr:hypothetical protein [Deinococcus kurensis]